MNFLLKEPGYHRLEDSYHPDYYRMAVLDKEISPELGFQNYSGSFDLTFSCMPQQYLKSGERQHYLRVWHHEGRIDSKVVVSMKPIVSSE